jgi:sec-independent protein translocase protein TatC
MDRENEVSSEELRTSVPALAGAGGGSSPPPPSVGDGEDDEEEGMLRMSFVEHLEEMRTRILRALLGVGVAFLTCIIFAYQIWDFVSAPAVDALKKLKIDPPDLVITQPMEGFSVIWVKVPLVVSLFVAAPWVVYQVWAFIAPGLYKNEKRWAVPFIAATGGLFILGGVFAYFVAFRYGLTFLLGIGLSGNVRPMVTITNYFDLFMNVMLGVALVFELPIVIFFLTLLRIASPRFLMRHSRYAILAIVILAAIITPTPDFFNLMLFAVPMCLLFFIGVFASYLLVLHREGRKFPWAKVLTVLGLAVIVLGGLLYWGLLKLGYHPVSHWPFIAK